MVVGSLVDPATPTIRHFCSNMPKKTYEGRGSTGQPNFKMSEKTGAGHSPKGNVVGMTCGFRGMRFRCVYVAAEFVWHLQSYEGEIRLGRHGVPVLLTVTSLAVLALTH